MLQFLEAEINYGGRVTDDKDRRLLNTIVRVYTCPQVLEKGYKFSESGIYYAPELKTMEEHLDFIRTFPLMPSPEAFGLHDNADITCAQNESFDLFADLLECQPKSAAGGGNKDAEVLERAADILKRIPASLDLHGAMDKYPTDYHESLNTVLTQEIIRYNNMLKGMNGSLKLLQKAVKGLVAMSAELDAVATALFNNQVPGAWASKAYPSLKPLASWLIDLEERLKFIQTWMDDGHQAAYWISGFFFPQAFLTGARQNFARKHQHAIDKVTFEHVFMDQVTPPPPPPKPGGPPSASARRITPYPHPLNYGPGDQGHGREARGRLHRVRHVHGELPLGLRGAPARGPGPEGALLGGTLPLAEAGVREASDGPSDGLRIAAVQDTRAHRHTLHHGALDQLCAVCRDSHGQAAVVLDPTFRCAVLRAQVLAPARGGAAVGRPCPCRARGG